VLNAGSVLSWFDADFSGYTKLKMSKGDHILVAFYGDIAFYAFKNQDKLPSYFSNLTLVFPRFYKFNAKQVIVYNNIFKIIFAIVWVVFGEIIRDTPFWNCILM